MKFLVVTLVLLGDPSGSSAPGNPSPLPADTAQQIAASVQTGTILACQGDCLAVRVYTLSSYTHVAAVVMENGQPYVYDSMPPMGVRKLPLNEYLLSQRPTDMQVFNPVKPLTESQRQALGGHLREQLGRPYDAKHYATGYRHAGLHCSEYLTDALVASNMIEVKNPAAVSPSSLLDSLTDLNLYQAGNIYDLPAPPEPPPPPAETWYGRAWQGTKSCSHSCWVQTKRWFCCSNK